MGPEPVGTVTRAARDLPGTGPVGQVLRYPGLALRRAIFFALAGLSAGAGVWLMLRIVAGGGVSLLECLILLLFAPTFAWIVLPFWTAMAGFLVLALGRDPLTLERGSRRERRRAPATVADSGAADTAPTAVVVPIYNEDPASVEARLAAMARSLEALGGTGDFHLHILSDTRDPEVAMAEEAAWARLQGTHPELAFFYRRREENTGRKAGNIAEFCQRCGDDYDFMVVLDADSLMTGETLLAMVARMRANPRLGLLQTLPLPVRGETLLARVIQFGSWVYAPILAAGSAFWHGGASNYWGHNAIIRLAAFREHARLPLLPGKPPLGGEILSHDFVEAALLTRAGWEVVLDPALGGSFEEVPTNLVDFARRDRRWAQGSLQHLRVLGMRGLHPLSRLHLLMGAMGYVSSLLWLLTLLAGTAYVFWPGLQGPAVRLGLPDAPLRLSLLAATAGILFLPKLLGLVLAARRARGFGGLLRLVGSAIVETAFSVLLAPVMMLHHSRSVLEILVGRSVGWGPQVRVGRTIPWRDALRVGAPAALVGVVWAGATLLGSPAFLVWMSPIFAGLLVSPALVRWTSSPAAGSAARRWGLFQAPCEVEPVAELRTMAETLRDLQHGNGVLASPDDSVTVTASQTGAPMYNAERGLFDLRRGRPLLIQAGGDAGEPRTRALVASVEGLSQEGLRSLETLAGGAPRLVVTHHRAAAMGLAPADSEEAGVDDGTTRLPVSAPSTYAVTLGLEQGVALGTVLQLASGRTGPWAGSAPEPGEARDTEVAGLRLAHLGQLLPALVSIPVSGELTPELQEALDSQAVLMADAEKILEFVQASRTDVIRVSDAPVPLSEAEDSRFILFREACGLGEHVAILVGSEESWPDPLPVRFHSACLTGDLFGSLRCDCGEQLRLSMEYFASQGGGVLVYLAQEGRGIGLGNKFRAYTLQETGLDTIDADGTLGFGADERRYDVAVKILHELGIQRIELLTNNPEKVQAVEAAGVQVVRRRALHGQLNPHNLPYVRAKVDRAGHWLHGMLRQGVAGD